MSGPDTRDPTEAECEAAPDTPETRRAAYEAAVAAGDTEASDGVLKEIGKWVLIVVLWMLPWWLLGQIGRWWWGY